MSGYDYVPELLRLPFPPGAPVLRFLNLYRGAVVFHRIIPTAVCWGATAEHPAPQWLLEAFDLDSASARTFALRDMEGVEIGP